MGDDAAFLVLGLLGYSALRRLGTDAANALGAAGAAAGAAVQQGWNWATPDIVANPTLAPTLYDAVPSYAAAALDPFRLSANVSDWLQQNTRWLPWWSQQFLYGSWLPAPSRLPAGFQPSTQITGTVRGLPYGSSLAYAGPGGSLWAWW